MHIQGDRWSGRGAQAASPGTGPKCNHCNVGSNVRMASAPSRVATFLDDYRPGHKVLRTRRCTDLTLHQVKELRVC